MPKIYFHFLFIYSIFIPYLCVMRNAKLRQIYMSEGVYQAAVKKANELELGFSAYVRLLVVKNLKEN